MFTYKAKVKCFVCSNPSAEPEDRVYVHLAKHDEIVANEELDSPHLKRVGAPDTDSVKDSFSRGGMNKERKVVQAGGDGVQRIDADAPKKSKAVADSQRKPVVRRKKN